MEREKGEESANLKGKFILAGTSIVLAALGGLAGIEMAALATGGSFNETAGLMLLTANKPVALLNYVQMIEFCAILGGLVSGAVAGAGINRLAGLEV